MDYFSLCSGSHLHAILLFFTVVFCSASYFQARILHMDINLICEIFGPNVGFSIWGDLNEVVWVHCRL